MTLIATIASAQKESAPSASSPEFTYPEICAPYLLFLGNLENPALAKTATGINYWAPNKCKAQISLPGGAADLKLPELTIEEAARQGCKTLVVGVAPMGGKIPDSWLAVFEEALHHNLDIASGMHHHLCENTKLVDLARSRGRRITDVRRPQSEFAVGTGQKRSGKRLLTVGTDCGVGKMFASLALAEEMKKRGANVDFRATGQTGILIAGSGVCVDAVVSDFVSGATEALSPDNDAGHWDIIEGQGSLYHPSYAGVSLGLLHGSQPDLIVMCHDPSRDQIMGLKGYRLPDIAECIETNLMAGRLVNPAIDITGVCLNTSKMPLDEAMGAIERIEKRLGLPVCDPVRTGVSAVVDKIAVQCGL